MPPALEAQHHGAFGAVGIAVVTDDARSYRLFVRHRASQFLFGDRDGLATSVFPDHGEEADHFSSLGTVATVDGVRVANAEIAPSRRAAQSWFLSIDGSEADQSSAQETLRHQQTPGQRVIFYAAIRGHNGETFPFDLLAAGESHVGGPARFG
jgi:hypothetical protein